MSFVFFSNILNNLQFTYSLISFLLILGINSACDTLREVNNMVQNTTNERQTRKMLTFDDDCSDEESDDDRSLEEIIALDNSSSSKSLTNKENNVRQSKRPLPNSFTTTTREKPSKRLYNKLSPSEDSGKKEIIMLLKTLLLSNDDLIKNINKSSRDVKNLIVLVEKLDDKVNVLFENQKKMQRALTKRKVNTNYDDILSVNNKLHIF
jgi:hypothetical protein